MHDIFNTNKIRDIFHRLSDAIDGARSVVCVGEVVKISGMKIEVRGLTESLGTVCKIIIDSHQVLNAEVIGFSENISYLMATQHVEGIKPGSKVISIPGYRKVKVGKALLGRVLDAEGNPIDGLGPIFSEDDYPLISQPMNPLERQVISASLDVGVRAINALLTVGKGQRVGIFSASGVGKSILLGMMTRFTQADVVVVGLVGERGREVKEFIEQILGRDGLKRSSVVVSPADTMPLMRANSALMATSIAEYYRDQGLDVLLIIDSLTRYAQAHREISLSAGEVPSTKGYTPSVFAKLSQLVERSGSGTKGKGTITAFYTVLVEGDDLNEPVADHIRSVLDGHICLSKSLADAGHYPAIDVEKSISRVMPLVVDNTHLAYASHFKQLYSAYIQNKDLISVGMYQAGADKMLDEAMRLREKMQSFLRQGVDESCNMTESLAQLTASISDVSQQVCA